MILFGFYNIRAFLTAGIFLLILLNDGVHQQNNIGKNLQLKLSKLYFHMQPKCLYAEF